MRHGAPVFPGLRNGLPVGVAGFEPTAPRSQSECATKLRYTPATERPVYGGHRRSNAAQPRRLHRPVRYRRAGAATAPGPRA